MCDECTGGGGGGSRDPCAGMTCPDDGDPCTEEYCEDGTCKSRKICANEGESCNNLPCRRDLECLQGCAGDWICCDEGQGAYCEDPPGQARRSYCGNRSYDVSNPNLTTCYGCFDTQGDCYAVGDCVTSPVCSSGWAKCKLWNNGIYSWGCAAEAECGSGGGGTGDWGGSGDGGDDGGNGNPTPPPIQFDLLGVRVELLHDGSHPETPILRVECDSEMEVDGLEVVLEPLGSPAGPPSPSPSTVPETTSTVPGPITVPDTKPGPVPISANAVFPVPVVPVKNDTDQGGDRYTGSRERGYAEGCWFDRWEDFTAVFYCNYGEKGQSRATCRFTGDQSQCETCEVSETFTIPEPILSVSVGKQAAKIGESILVSMAGRSWIYVDRVDLLVDGQVARTFDHAGQRLLSIRDSTSIQLPKGRHEIAFRATDFVGDSFESNPVNVLVGSNAYYCQINPEILQAEDCGNGCSLQVSCFAKNGTPEMCPAMEWEATAGRIEGSGEEATYYSTNESAVITAAGTLMECSALVVGSLEQPSLVNGVDLVLLSSEAFEGEALLG